ncbi:MAG: acyltransferase family protein, partial [bacterium]|nr:acyltransferase family protein [bacterium]
ASVLQVLYAWGMCFGLMGLFRVLLPRERRGIRYLSDSAYWVYLVHLPLVVAAQMLVFDWDLFAGVKFLLICGVVTAVSLLSYQAFVRYTPIGAMLNGKKVRTARSGASG